jgi:hypothetical protein
VAGEKMKNIEVNIQGQLVEMQVPDGMPDAQISAEVDKIGQQMGQPQQPGAMDQAIAQAKQSPTGMLADVVMQGYNKGMNLFEKGGAQVAEGLAGSGMNMQPAFGIPGMPKLPGEAQPGEESIKTSPEVAAGIGTGIQMAPHAAMSAGSLGPAAKAGSLVGKGGKALVKPLRTFVKRLTGKGEKLTKLESDAMLNELKLAKEAAEEGSTNQRAYSQAYEHVKRQLADVKDNYKVMKAGLDEARGDIGKQIGVVEQKLGLGLKDSSYVEKMLSNPKAVQASAQRMIHLGNKSPEVLKQLGSQTIQQTKKLTEALIKRGGLDDTTKVLLKQANTNIGKAIPETAKLRAELGSVYKQLKELPKAYKSKSAELGKRLTKYQTRLKQLKKSDTQTIKQLKKKIAEASYESHQLIIEAHKNDAVRKKTLYAILSLSGLGGFGKLLSTVGGQ